ncbi:MerR family transcriptional regulator [candidate division KSB1 bacterium]
MGKKNNYTIKAAAQLTGLNHHILRKWEQRYGAVTPERTETNRRLYSGSDIERLRFLKAATEQGQSIGSAVKMNDDELRILVQSHNINRKNWNSNKNGEEFLYDPHYHYDKCLYAVKELNPQALRMSLYYAEHLLSKRILLEQVVIPLLQKIGTMWEIGQISVAHEHNATAIIRSYIGNQLASLNMHDNAPVIVIASPAGQRHEIGALIAAITAMTEGWNAIYLGADLPAQEIIAAAKSQKARIIAVSLVFPEDNPDTRKELIELKKYIGDTLYLIAGGRASQSYRDLFNDSNALLMQNFGEFRLFLHAMTKKL